jgi:hypothetical protein
VPAKILPAANQAPHKIEGLPRRLFSRMWRSEGPNVEEFK